MSRTVPVLLGARFLPTGRAGGRVGRACRVLALLMTLPAAGARAQERIEDFATQPQLVLNERGHHAPVNRLLFSADGALAYTAGDDRVVHVWDLAGNAPGLRKSLRPFIWSGRRGIVDAMVLVPPGRGDAAPRLLLGGRVPALAPPDAAPRLVLGGRSTTGSEGDLAVFRLSDDPARPANDLVANWGILRDPEGNPAGSVHVRRVTGLAFHPRSRRLASSSADGTIRIWDASAGRPTRTLTDGQAAEARVGLDVGRREDATWIPSQALDIHPSGRWVAAGGLDGVIRVWDLAADPRADAQPRKFRGDGAAAGEGRYPSRAVSCLAFSPDGNWLLVGLDAPNPANPANPDTRVLSGLFLFRAADASFAFAAALPFERPGAVAGQGPSSLGAVQAIAFRHDSGLVAVSVAERPWGRAELPKVMSLVQVRRMPDGAVITWIPDGAAAAWPGRIEALAFAPDGRRLGFVDGDRRLLRVKDITEAQAALITVRGLGDAPGRAIREVGFRGDGGSVVGFRREGEIGPAAAPAGLRGFDLLGRRPVDIPAAEVRRAVTAWQGWSVRPVGLFALDVLRPQGQPTLRVDLDPNSLGRWYSYTFLPPNKDRPAPCLAVGCEFGIGVFRLDATPAPQTRLLRGHEGQVWALAPSGDGAWLVSGSEDQTLRLWLLAGRDRVRPFGATLRQDGDRWVVAAVEPRSAAEFADVRAGDQVVEAYVTDERRNLFTRPVPVDAGLQALLDGQTPGRKFELKLRRAGRAADVDISTHKYDDPALSVFIDEAEDDWVAWMPSGFYETSVQGDRRYLGWQINRGSPLEVRPPDFVPMIQFEQRLRRRQVIEGLLRTGDVAQAINLAGNAAPPDLKQDLPLSAEVRLGPPPRATGRDGVEVGDPVLPVTLAVRSPDGVRRLGSVEVLDNGRFELAVPVNPPAAPVDLDLRLAVGEGPRVKTFVLVSDTGLRREVNWPYVGRRSPPPAPTPAPRARPRLEVLAFNPSFSESLGLATVGEPELARAVAQDLRLVTVEPGSQGPYAQRRPEDRVRVRLHLPGRQGDRAADLRDALADLRGEAAAGRLGAGAGPTDTVVLFLDTHVFEGGSRGAVLGSEFDPKEADAGRMPAEALVEDLGALVRAGCRVVVFLDGIHEMPKGWNADIVELSRGLQAARVATFVASKTTPSRPGVFAGSLRGILRGEERADEGDLGAGAFSPLGLGATLRSAVEAGVAGRRQQTMFYPAGTSFDRLQLFQAGGR